MSIKKVMSIKDKRVWNWICVAVPVYKEFILKIYSENKDISMQTAEDIFFQNTNLPNRILRTYTNARN
jgi:hypothetical protein